MACSWACWGRSEQRWLHGLQLSLLAGAAFYRMADSSASLLDECSSVPRWLAAKPAEGI
jgi:hypothetical protein